MCAGEGRRYREGGKRWPHLSVRRAGLGGLKLGLPANSRKAKMEVAIDAGRGGAHLGHGHWKPMRWATDLVSACNGRQALVSNPLCASGTGRGRGVCAPSSPRRKGRSCSLPPRMRASPPRTARAKAKSTTLSKIDLPPALCRATGDIWFVRVRTSSLSSSLSSIRVGFRRSMLG